MAPRTAASAAFVVGSRTFEALEFDQGKLVKAYEHQAKQLIEAKQAEKR